MLPDDDERDDGAAVESHVARTARAAHLRSSGNGITLTQQRRTSTRLPMTIAR